MTCLVITDPFPTASAVRYLLREDPKQLLCIQVDSSSLPSHVAYSPDGLVVGVAIHRSILFYSTGSGQLLETLDSIHNG